MRNIKTLGLLAMAAFALVAFAGSASATVTSPKGTKLGVIVATSTNTELDGTVKITCKHSEVETTGVNANDEGEAGSDTGRVDWLSFTECNRSVTVTNTGHIRISTETSNDFPPRAITVVKSTGARITVQTTILGFPVHCIYATNNTKVGTLTDGVEPAKLHIGSSPIPQEATSGACGNDAVWTGTYTVEIPETPIFIDQFIP